jgi:hypothetical protein
MTSLTATEKAFLPAGLLDARQAAEEAAAAANDAFYVFSLPFLLAPKQPPPPLGKAPVLNDNVKMRCVVESFAWN